MKKTILLTLAICCFIGAYAQEEEPSFVSLTANDISLKGNATVGAFGEIISLAPVKKTATAPRGKRATPFDSRNFTGYSIQIEETMELLPADSRLFAEFGDLMLEEATNPKYCYMLGKFSTEEGAEHFKKNVLQNRYPAAKIVRYKKGKRR
jgi:hypothetical protein